MVETPILERGVALGFEMLKFRSMRVGADAERASSLTAGRNQPTVTPAKRCTEILDVPTGLRAYRPPSAPTQGSLVVQRELQHSNGLWKATTDGSLRTSVSIAS